MLAGVAGISLVVGGIGVTNVMLITVRERTREIGIRKALGAQRASIAGQFLLEATFLSLIGGGLGALDIEGVEFQRRGANLLAGHAEHCTEAHGDHDCDRAAVC